MCAIAVTALVEHIAAACADLLIRCKDHRVLPPIKTLPDRTWLARMGSVTVRVIDARINVAFDGGTTRCGHYRLITTLIDEKRYPAQELVRLYHHRGEIETSYLEMKSTILSGRVLRAATPAGITQEVYALLITYQALRTAIAVTSLTHPTISPDRLSFTVAVHTAHDQVVAAAATIFEGNPIISGPERACVSNGPKPDTRSLSVRRREAPIADGLPGGGRLADRLSAVTSPRYRLYQPLVHRDLAIADLSDPGDTHVEQVDHLANHLVVAVSSGRRCRPGPPRSVRYRAAHPHSPQHVSK